MRFLLTILCLFVFSCDDDEPLGYITGCENDCNEDITGCMDIEACNYDESANINDASCWYQGVDNDSFCSCEDGFGADFVCFFDCGSDLNVITGEVMCPTDSYSLNTGFNLAGPDGTEVDIDVVVNDNQYYAGFEVDPNTGEYIQATGPDGELLVDDNLDPIYIPTQDAIDLYDQCVNLNCTAQQYNDLFVDELISTDSNQTEMTGNDNWDDGELTTDNISNINNFTICECYNNLNE